MRTGKGYDEPTGTHTYAVYATYRGKRERQSKYLTRIGAQHFADMFSDKSAREFGFSYVRVVNEKVKK
jgi:hypothetical protein